MSVRRSEAHYNPVQLCTSNFVAIVLGRHGCDLDVMAWCPHSFGHIVLVHTDYITDKCNCTTVFKTVLIVF